MTSRIFRHPGLILLTTASFLSLQQPVALAAVLAEPAAEEAPAADEAAGQDSAPADDAAQAESPAAETEAAAEEAAAEEAAAEEAPAEAGAEEAPAEEAAAEEAAAEEVPAEEAAAEEAAAEEAGAEEAPAEDDAALSASGDLDGFSLDDDAGPKKNGKGLLIAGGTSLGLGLTVGLVSIPLTRCPVEGQTCEAGEQRVLFVASAAALGVLGGILLTAGGVTMARSKRADKDEASAFFAPMFMQGGGGLGAAGRF